MTPTANYFLRRSVVDLVNDRGPTAIMAALMIGGNRRPSPHVHHDRFTIQTARSLIMMHATTCDKKCTTAVRVTRGMSRNRRIFVIDSSEPIQNLVFYDKNIEDTIFYKLTMKIMRNVLGELNSKNEKLYIFQAIFTLKSSLHGLKIGNYITFDICAKKY